MRKDEALVYYVLIDDLRTTEGNLFLPAPINSAYLKEQMAALKEETACKRVVIRNIVYL